MIMFINGDVHTRASMSSILAPSPLLEEGGLGAHRREDPERPQQLRPVEEQRRRVVEDAGEPGCIVEQQVRAQVGEPVVEEGGGGGGGRGRREGSQPRSKPATSKGWEEEMELRREERQVLGSMLKTEDGEHEAEESTAFNNKPSPPTAPPPQSAGDEKATSFIIPCSWPWWKSWPAVLTYQSSSNIDRKVDRPMSSVGLSPTTAAPRVQKTACSSSPAPESIHTTPPFTLDSISTQVVVKWSEEEDEREALLLFQKMAAMEATRGAQTGSS